MGLFSNKSNQKKIDEKTAEELFSEGNKFLALDDNKKAFEERFRGGLRLKY